MKCAVLLSLFVLGGAHRNADLSLRRGAKGGALGFVRALEFKYKLRVCNAYPSDKSLTVTKSKDDIVTDMPYKSCADVESPLKPGDKLEFKMDGTEVGTFSISDLPQNDATLMLALYRHDTLSSAVAFESHVFANLANSQVAVIDAYKGAEKAGVKIQDQKDGKYSRSEDLRYDSVVAVNPGKYECVLVGSDGKEKSRTALVAVAKESYVVLRVGVEDEKKPYTQELMAYPKSDGVAESGAPCTSISGVLLAILALTLVKQ